MNEHPHEKGGIIMDFSRLTAYLDYLHKLNVPGCDLALYRDHELIYRHQAGWRDLAHTAPAQPCS